jgi:hypothetical protein
MHLRPEPAQSLCDCLVPVLGGVLVDHRGTGARMTEARHQLFETGAGCGGRRSPRLLGARSKQPFR